MIIIKVNQTLNWKGVEGNSTYRDDFHTFNDLNKNDSKSNNRQRARDILGGNMMAELMDWKYDSSIEDEQEAQHTVMLSSEGFVLVEL